MNKRKILITSRSFGATDDTPRKNLEDAGFEPVYYNDGFDEGIFKEKLRDCFGLIIGSHPLTHEAVENASSLRIVSKHGTGLDNIDLVFMKQRGITVRNVPAVNSEAVADLAFGLAVDVSRSITNAAFEVRENRWRMVTGVDIHHKVLGLIGFGKIAQCMARRAGGFSMKVVAYDPYIRSVPEEFKEAVTLSSFDELLAEADIVSVHVPLTDSTRDMLSCDEMARMKKNGIIINTSRGGIVNEADLLKAVESGEIYGAGLDVILREPLDHDSPLRSSDRILITPHIGMYSKETLADVSRIAAENIIKFRDHHN